MTVTQAYLIKGWLLGANAPEQVWDAIDAVIATLSVLPADNTSPADTSPQPDLQEGYEACSKPRKKREWSPEQRVAAGERMRAARAKRWSTPVGEAQAPSQGGA